MDYMKFCVTNLTRTSDTSVNERSYHEVMVHVLCEQLKVSTLSHDIANNKSSREYPSISYGLAILYKKVFGDTGCQGHYDNQVWNYPPLANVIFLCDMEQFSQVTPMVAVKADCCIVDSQMTASHIRYDKIRSYDKRIFESILNDSNVGCRTILYHSIVLRHLERYDVALQLLENKTNLFSSEATEASIYHRTLYVIEKAACLDLSRHEIAIRMHHLRASYDREYRRFCKNDIRKKSDSIVQLLKTVDLTHLQAETIFYIKLVLAEQYLKMQPSLNLYKAGKELLEACRTYGYISDYLHFWLLFVSYAYKTKDKLFYIYMSFARYYMSSYANKSMQCRYYAWYATALYELIRSDDAEIKNNAIDSLERCNRDFHKLFITHCIENEVSTFPALMSVFERHVYVLKRFENIYVALCNRREFPECQRNFFKSRAIDWADDRFSHSWKNELEFSRKKTKLRKQNSNTPSEIIDNMPEHSAYLIFDTFYQPGYERVFCEIITKNGVEQEIIHLFKGADGSFDEWLKKLYLQPSLNHDNAYQFDKQFSQFESTFKEFGDYYLQNAEWPFYQRIAAKLPNRENTTVRIVNEEDWQNFTYKKRKRTDDTVYILLSFSGFSKKSKIAYCYIVYPDDLKLIMPISMESYITTRQKFAKNLTLREESKLI
jgi:hypothetical protein